ncbi:5-(carboxyamino)imidazole ribonucleotide synthase [bacterium]|nr:MAG: 5-(carboxyamino)imidazole ribonucleotide synthase [bacterium]
MRIGILGGGQLGRMLALAGHPLGLDVRLLDASPDAPAGRVAPLVVGDLADPAVVARFAGGLDRATYEFENVPLAAARALAAQVPVFPPPAALETAQDRLAEKACFAALGIATAPFAAVDAPADLERALDTIGLPAVLKTRRLGYDGKGQWRLRSVDDVAAARRVLDGTPMLVERLVPFDRELSILAVRGHDGATACYPLVANTHAAGILRWSRAPAPAAAHLQAPAEAWAARVLDRLGYVGVLAIELFEVGGRLVANEMAPRVHNSGHWTIEGAETSQFENHLRAVAGLPLGATAPVGESLMVNGIGAMPDAAAVLAIPGAHLHDYGKAPRPGRKVGHVTLRADDAATLEARAAALRAVMPPGAVPPAPG